MYVQISDPLTPEKIENDLTAIGIDFGTTHCVASYVHKGKLETIPLTATGGDLLPSVVGVESGQIKVIQDRSVGLSSVKRIMGRSFTEVLATCPEYAGILKNSPDGIKLLTDLGYKTSVELAVVIFRHIKQAAELHLNKVIDDAVVTVPAYFDDTARTSIRDAAKLAGFNVLRLIAEPTAAAFAYGLDTKAEGNYLVYDLGGGTFDVSVLKLNQGVFQVLATGGDPLLGGDDIDDLIVDHFQLQGLGPQERKQAIQSARQVKEKLSTQQKATFDSPHGDRSVLKQEVFETLVDSFVSKTCNIVAETLEDSNISASDIQGIILVGGSTRIPLVRQQLTSRFNLPIYGEIDPDRVVAAGAAYQANALTHGGDNVLVDVTPLSLGVEMMGGAVEKVIRRNTPIPIQKSQQFTTFQDNQSGLVIHVLQGEREMTADCRSLGRFTLSGIPPMPAGMPKITVTFTLDADGLLTVGAREDTVGVSQSIQVKPSYGLSEATMAEMILESQKFAESDMLQRLLQQSKTKAQQLIEAVQKAIEMDGELLSPNELKQIEEGVSALLKAKESDNRASITDATDQLEKATADFAHRRVAKHLQDQID